MLRCENATIIIIFVTSVSIYQTNDVMDIHSGETGNVHGN